MLLLPWVQAATVDASVCVGEQCSAWPQAERAGALRVSGAPGHVYVVALTQRGWCDIAFPVVAADRDRNVVTSAPLDLALGRDITWQPTWASVHVIVLSLPLESYDERITCELARTGQTLDAYLSVYHPTDPTWGALLGEWRKDKTRAIDHRGNHTTAAPPAPTTPPSSAYEQPAVGGELGRDKLLRP